MKLILCALLIAATSFARAGEPVTILVQPQSVEVPELSLVRLSVEATGSIDGYTWVNDLGNVVGESGPSANILELVRVSLGRSISYRVMITNGTTIVTSAFATVTVRSVTVAPEVIWKGRRLTKVIGNGTEVPGFPGSYFFQVGSGTRPPITIGYRDGTLYFAAVAPAPARWGLFRWKNGTLTTLVYTNTVTPTGDVSSVTEEGDGRVNFSTSAWTPTTLAAASLNTWSEQEGARIMIDRGTSAPGRLANFRSFGNGARRGSGVAFLAFLDLGGLPGPAGIYFHDGTTLIRIADDTTDLPGVSGNFAAAIGPTSGSFFARLNFDGEHIVFSSGGLFKATRQGVITKVADSDDFVPGSTNRFTPFGQVDINGGLVFGISNRKAYAFDDNGGIRAMGNANIISAAGPRMAYFANGLGSSLYRWNDGTNETVISALGQGFNVFEVLDIDSQGDDVAVLLRTEDGGGIYVVSGPPVTGSPVILTEPLDVNVATLSLAIFAVTADGPRPLHYQWRSDGVDIPNATNNTLRVDSTTPAAMEGYAVVVTNSFGSVTSRTARLTRTEPLSLYLGSPHLQVSSISYSSNITITVLAGGPRPILYQWRKGGIDLPGETGPSLTLTNLSEPNRGSYEVLVADGTKTLSAATTVDFIMPVITQQPESVVSLAGTTASFGITAIGVPPLTYQWYQVRTNTGSPLTGATNTTLVLTNVSSLDVGEYYVTVRSEAKLFQTVFSQRSALTVLHDGPAQPPLLETPVYTAAKIFQFRLVTERGRAYEVQFTPSLENESWTVLQTVRGDGEAILVTVPGGTVEGYYRAKVIP